MLGCEPGAEGCLGKLLDPLPSGRAGGATWGGEGDVENTQMNVTLGKHARELKFYLQLNHCISKNINPSGRFCDLQYKQDLKFLTPCHLA